MKRWEVFNPMDGITVHSFRWRWLARLVARMTYMDYAPHGEGW